MVEISYALGEINKKSRKISAKIMRKSRPKIRNQTFGLERGQLGERLARGRRQKPAALRRQLSARDHSREPAARYRRRAGRIFFLEPLRT